MTHISPEDVKGLRKRLRMIVGTQFTPLETRLVLEAEAMLEAQSRAYVALAERVGAMEGALTAILAIDGPYCDSCHSSDIGDAYQIARAALNLQSTREQEGK